MRGISLKSLLPVLALFGAMSHPQPAMADQCNWKGTLYSLCAGKQRGWGVESGQTCVGTRSCQAQRAPWGVVKSTPVVQNICDPYLASDTQLPAGWKYQAVVVSGQLTYSVVSDPASPGTPTPDGFTLQCRTTSDGERFPVLVPPLVGEKTVGVGAACGFIDNSGFLQTCSSLAQCVSTTSGGPAFCRIPVSPPPPATGTSQPVCSPGVYIIDYAPAGWRFQFGTPNNGTPNPQLIAAPQALQAPLPTGYLIQCRTTSDGERFPSFIIP